ncbi:hypothetical protein ES332_A06G204800v1 [Gossypium tomentosum]|uniref:Uncharacterized protein n=1 Tax=Gossypium tomentosum TaxID=34277 RepID=A0A5D2Q769_GOSTO|nr:hypothetical protein ES332_A06G204800v1 [Gossypium tomentosum]
MSSLASPSPSPSPSSSASSSIIYCLTFLLSLFLLGLFAPQFFPLRKNQERQPLIPMNEELDDLHLFELASNIELSHAVPKISHLRTANSHPKIAFLFLTNSDLVFAPLWQRIFQGNEHLFNVYIHADPFTKLSPPDWSIKANFIPAKKTHRGSPTLVNAARRLLANAIIDDSSNLYFALLSQRCIPLHSFKYIYGSLLGNPNSPSSYKAFGNQRRHKSYIEILFGEPHLFNRYVARGPRVMLPEISFGRFRIGSQFFILAKRHSLLVLKERMLWSKFKLPCIDLYSCYPEEHYFPTLLSMEDPKGCSHYTLTRVNWNDSIDGHPHTYHSPEVSPKLLRQLRTSNSSHSYFFARKFAPDCLKPLLKIADEAIFRD